MIKTRISPKFQIVIPKEIRRKLNLKRGQEMISLIKDGGVLYVPDRPLSELKGYLKGLDTKGLREEEERL